MNIPQDKLQHIGVCFCVAFAISTLVAVISENCVASALASFMGACACGAAKEYGDKTNGGMWDWLDIAADTLGAILGALVGTAILLIH